MKIIHGKPLIITFCLMIVSTTYPYTMKVKNHTPFMIEVVCITVGALGTGYKAIAPDDTLTIHCGGADCVKGIKILIKGAEAGWVECNECKHGKKYNTCKDCKKPEDYGYCIAESKWNLNCGDDTVEVLLIPNFTITAGERKSIEAQLIKMGASPADAKVQAASFRNPSGIEGLNHIRRYTVGVARNVKEYDEKIPFVCK